MTDLHNYARLNDQKDNPPIPPADLEKCRDLPPISGKKLVSFSRVSRYSQWLNELTYDSQDNENKTVRVVETESDLVPLTTTLPPFRRRLSRKNNNQQDQPKKSKHLYSSLDNDNDYID